MWSFIVAKTGPVITSGPEWTSSGSMNGARSWSTGTCCRLRPTGRKLQRNVLMPSTRRFPPSWTVEDRNDDCHFRTDEVFGCQT
jgi:hypothetical protein